MKRFLSAGKRCVLFGACLLLVNTFILCNNLSFGQKATQRTTTNSIGEKLNKNFVIGFDPFDHERKYTLSDFKGKAIILDIWATWCSACIGRFPAMDSLSRVYGENLEILLVAAIGRDTPETVRTFVEEYRQANPDFSLTFLIEDVKYSTTYSFRSLPHYIWIDPNRRIRAHTNPQAFEDNHLLRLISGRSVHVPIKLN